MITARTQNYYFRDGLIFHSVVYHNIFSSSPIEVYCFDFDFYHYEKCCSWHLVHVSLFHSCSFISLVKEQNTKILIDIARVLSKRKKQLTCIAVMNGSIPFLSFLY